MPVVNYHTVNGQMVGQSTGTTFTQYLTDALGSVTATVNGKRVTNTYRYKPYGERLAKTGTGPDPDFQWTGDTGSRVTGRSRADQYNRARHYGSSQASWTTADPIWPIQSQFLYCGLRPTWVLDPTGLILDMGYECGTKYAACADWYKSNESAIAQCLISKGFHFWDVVALLLRMRDAVNPSGRRYCVRCDRGDAGTDLPPCADDCRKRPGANGTCLYSDITHPFPNRGYPESDDWNSRADTINLIFPRSTRDCLNTDVSNRSCDCIVAVCEENIARSIWRQKSPSTFCEIMFHEFGHCTGSGHKKPWSNDIIYAFGECIAKIWNK